MAKEIERKFLVRSDEWRSHVASSAKLVQAYVTVNDDRNVRVRLIDEMSAKLTIKVGTSTMVRDEFEYDIPLNDAEELASCAIGIVIEKTRHKVPVADKTFEIDVYDGFYSGLVVAEVELKSEDEHFERPDWLGDEVTADRRYSNMVLATTDLARELIHGVSHSAI